MGITYEYRKTAAARIIRLVLSDDADGNQVEYIKVPTKQIRAYFRRDTTPQQMTETILKAMDFYNKHLERQRQERDAR